MLFVVRCVLFDARCVLFVAGLFAVYVKVIVDDCLLCGGLCL